jgi:hypothetical protein
METMLSYIYDYGMASDVMADSAITDQCKYIPVSVPQSHSPDKLTHVAWYGYRTFDPGRERSLRC